MYVICPNKIFQGSPKTCKKAPFEATITQTRCSPKTYEIVLKNMQKSTVWGHDYTSMMFPENIRNITFFLTHFFGENFHKFLFMSNFTGNVTKHYFLCPNKNFQGSPKTRKKAPFGAQITHQRILRKQPKYYCFVKKQADF